MDTRSQRDGHDTPKLVTGDGALGAWVALRDVFPDAREQRCWHDCPAEHRRHLRTTNPIESSFATLKLRTRVTKGAGSKEAALAMAYKRLDAASRRWRRFNGHELVADLLAGVKSKDGIRVTDDENHHEMTHEEVAA